MAIQIGSIDDDALAQGSGLKAAKSSPNEYPINSDRAKHHAQRMLDRIREAHAAGKRKKADYLTQKYLQSYDAKYIATREALRGLAKSRRPSPALLPVIAEGLDAWQGTDEDVLLRFQPKESNPNEFRPILDFGIERRSLQYLVRSVLQIRADQHPNQYLLKGIHKAVARVAELLADGSKWAIETDIKNCYTSFDGEKVPGLLPLPRRVTRGSLLSVSLNVKFHPFWASLLVQPGEGAKDLMSAPELVDARRGFPQGSAASPLAVEMLLAPLFAQLPNCGASIGYADNFLAMASCQSDALSVTSALCSALNAHPAGHLEPKPPRIYEPGEPILFLGHQFSRHGGSVRIHPAPRNEAKFCDRMHQGLDAIRSSPNAWQAARLTQKLKRYVKSWTGAFGLCTGIEARRMLAFKHIEQALKYC